MREYGFIPAIGALLLTLCLLCLLPGRASAEVIEPEVVRADATIHLYANARDLPEGVYAGQHAEITVDPGNPCYRVENGFLIDQLTDTLLYSAPSSGAFPLPAVRRLGADCLANWLPARIEPITVPDTVEEIGPRVFVTDQPITLPMGLRWIASEAFMSTSRDARTIEIPASVTLVEWKAFTQTSDWADWQSDEEIWDVVYLGNSTHRETVEEYALRTLCQGTVPLATEEVDGPYRYNRMNGWAELTYCDFDALGDGKMPETLTLPQYVGEDHLPVRGIGSNALNMSLYGDSMDTLVIPEGVTYFQDDALQCCEMVGHIVLPSTLSRIPEGCFSHVCADFTFSAPNPYYRIENGCLIDVRSDTLLYCALGVSTVPAVRRIGVLSMSNFGFIKVEGTEDTEDKYDSPPAPWTLTFPDTVEEIGAYAAFESLWGCTEIHLPPHLRLLESCALYTDTEFEVRVPASCRFVEYGDVNAEDGSPTLVPEGEDTYFQTEEEYELTW